jgi:hypothetical protein
MKTKKMALPMVLALIATVFVAGARAQTTSSPKATVQHMPVNALNFVRAETDSYMALFVSQGYFANFKHIRVPTPIAEQDVIRMNRDTLYSGAVYDLTSPVTINMPDNEGRFQSMLIINQDHYVVGIEHEGGDYKFTENLAGTRYIVAIIRTFVDANDSADIEKANRLQDAIRFEQADIGSFDVPDWDRVSLDRTRGLLNALTADLPGELTGAFGAKEEVNPILHFILTGSGWGGNPPAAAVYRIVALTGNDGSTPYAVTVKDVPVDGFWSITVYNDDGYMQTNDFDAHSVNNITGERKADGSVTVHFGDCIDGRVNCLPITAGWNYVVRLYRPRDEILDGSWKFPDPEPTN